MPIGNKASTMLMGSARIVRRDDFIFISAEGIEVSVCTPVEVARSNASRIISACNGGDTPPQTNIIDVTSGRTRNGTRLLDQKPEVDYEGRFVFVRTDYDRTAAMRFSDYYAYLRRELRNCERHHALLCQGGGSVVPLPVDRDTS